MHIGSSIKSFIQNHGTKIITKGVGLTALGAVCYDAHYVGKITSDTYASEKDAASVGYYLNNSLYSTNMSKIQENLKDASYEMELDCGWKRFINSGIGYIKGFTSMLISHVVPFGLGLGALLTKGKASKICAGGLGLYAGYEILKNFFGWGAPGGLSK
ncbi:hypothetical protein HDR58_08095 [bacterium]|nr:hypothetical protein [bacterium]